MDFSIPEYLPVEAQRRLQELVQDFQEENLTQKGYTNKRAQLIDKYTSYNGGRNERVSSDRYEPRISIDSDNKSTSTHINVTRKIDSNHLQVYQTPDSHSLHKLSSASTNGTPVSALQNTRHQEIMPQSAFNTPQSNNGFVDTSTTPSSKVSLVKNNSLSQRASINRHNTSLHHRKKSSQISLPFDLIANQYDPMTPILPRVETLTPTFKGASLTYILQARSVIQQKETAIITINVKGKEKLLSWSKLHGRSERIAQELTKNKKKIHKMAKILLWFDQDDLLEFVVSLFGCFSADMVAVPVSFDTYSLNEIIEIIKLTNSKNILISDDCYKNLENLTTNNGKLKLLKSEFFQDINFIKTNDLGTYTKAKNINNIPNISYIEFTRTPLGKLSGVLMKHKTLENQFELFAQVLNSRNPKTKVIRPIKLSPGKTTASMATRYTVINSLDSTRNTGLIFGLLFNIFSGNLMIHINSKYLSMSSGNLETCVDKYRANVLLCDQLQLKQVVINYLDNPELMQKKNKRKIDFSCIKFCLTTCTTIDTEVSDMIVQKWLKNLGCIDASQCYSPVLTLPDFGGCFLSFRDQLSIPPKTLKKVHGQVQLITDDNFSAEYDDSAESTGNGSLIKFKNNTQDDIYIEKEPLKDNVIKISSTPMVGASSSAQKHIKLSAFGFPLVDSFLAVVNPDDGTLVQDSTVGELWISSSSMTNEFYHMDKVNDFVFKAKLNYNKMFRMLEKSNAMQQSFQKLKAIMQICPSETSFLRTKLIGFVHNNKIYVLSLVEDMVLQNKLIRLSNGLHTCDLTSSSVTSTSSDAASSLSLSANLHNRDPRLLKKRVVQTHYLQHITENIVRTVEHVREISAFELPQYKLEHFLVICIESDLVKSSSEPSSSSDKVLNSFVDKIYKILWIFHRIQPMCIMVLPVGSLPKRYCSLEIANSTVEKKYFSAQLNVKFVKFQLDNVILDFIPRTSCENESVFSEHLSNYRHASIEDVILRQGHTQANFTQFFQTTNNNIVESSVDTRTHILLNKYKSIMEILEFRCGQQGNDLAYSDGYATAPPKNSNNYHKSITWSSFNNMVASYLKKIVESKTPLKSGDSIIVVSENSVEYAAMVITAFYCGFNIIPMPSFNQSSITPQKDTEFFAKVVKAYKVKRIFCDFLNQTYIEDSNTVTGKFFKKLKHMLPRVTIFSKVKVKSQHNIKFFKSQIKSKLGTVREASVVFVDKSDDMSSKLVTTMSASTLLNLCKQYKNVLHLSSDFRLLSACSHTDQIGFVRSCLLGIYVGTTTTLYSVSDIKHDPKEFFMDMKNLTIKDLFLSKELFTFILMKAKENVLRGIPHILLPVKGRPDHYFNLKLVLKYPQAGCNMGNLNYIYENKFNPFISLRSYPPISIFLDCESLRVGIIKEVDPHEEPNCIEIHDSGVPVCEELRIMNPENGQNTYINELGEIFVSSSKNVDNYCLIDQSGKLVRDKFLTKQLMTDVGGKTFMRTGDLGFVKPFMIDNKQVNILFVLSEINNTIESSGFHCAVDLEKTVETIHACIEKCRVAKMGGYTIALVELRKELKNQKGNLVPIIASNILQKHKLIINLVCFVSRIKDSRSQTINDFVKNNENYIYGVYRSL